MPVASSSNVCGYGACGVYNRTIEVSKMLRVELDTRGGHNNAAQDGFLGGPACGNVCGGAHGVDGGGFGFDDGD